MEKANGIVASWKNRENLNKIWEGWDARKIGRGGRDTGEKSKGKIDTKWVGNLK